MNKAGQLGPRRRKFLATYEGGTKQAQRDEEGHVIFFSGKGQDPHGSMINIGSEALPRMIPVSHVQPVAKASAAARIPSELMGGVKMEDAKKYVNGQKQTRICRNHTFFGIFFFLFFGRDTEKMYQIFSLKLFWINLSKL